MKKISIVIEEVGELDSKNGIGIILRHYNEADDVTRLRMIFNSVLDLLFDGKYRVSIQSNPKEGGEEK